jgi:crotonobetainyl-CoA:carnitine CoA-transferase CaiB-like acyl-CoA transferase
VPDAGPLAGILVADFSRVLAGPLATMLLGDLGADVIKVERPDGGDDTRSWGPPWVGGESTYYLGLNRNKRSIALDFGVEEDLELARALALRADVLIESFRPGLMARWGLDPETLRKRNPGLVTCSVTAFGTAEQARALPGYDFLLQAMGGLMSVTGAEDGPPLKAGTAVVDLVTGLLAANGIQAALVDRARGGPGRHVDVSLMDGALTVLLNQGSAWVSAGVNGRRRGNRHPSIVPYELYDTADRPIAVAAANQRHFTRMCEALGLGELADDERFATNEARVEHVDAFAEAVGAVLRERPAGHWLERLRSAGVPAGPVNGIDEAFALAEELGLEPTEAVDGLPLIRSPLRVDGERPHIRRAPPALGEHSEELKEWLRGPGAPRRPRP